MTEKTKTTEKFSMKGWKFLEFLKGRKKLLVAAIGAIVGYIATQNPTIAGLTAVGADFLYALVDYYLKE